MSERDFIYWLQGFFEMTNAESLNEGQVKMIKNHLSLVMTKVTPLLSPSDMEKVEWIKKIRPDLGGPIC